MGVVVAFVSQKGGVGKSTLARALAREAAAGGLSVKVADLDVQQGTLVNWQRRRLAANRKPGVSVESFRSAESALNGRDTYDLLVLVPSRRRMACRDRQTHSAPAGLCRPAQALDRGAYAGLDRPLSPVQQGLRTQRPNQRVFDSAGDDPADAETAHKIR